MTPKLFGMAAVSFGALVYLLREKKCDAKLLQPYFNKFHDNIKLVNVEENAKLREKRDLLLEDLKTFLPSDAPRWRCFNQGSYAMGTGINPPDGDFDIDVGIAFECTRTSFPDPLALKKLVCDALKRGNRTVLIRRPCVTIRYITNGQTHYHVDLAVYAKQREGSGLDLAMGKLRSSKKYRKWSEQDPELLVAKIKSKFSGQDAEQFRRCIRYLKRWKNEQFRNGGAPMSIALTCAAFYWFKPCSEDTWTGPQYFDAQALRDLIERMLRGFSTQLQICLPVAPHVDLLGDMTPVQMRAFKEKLCILQDALQVAMSRPATQVSDARDILAQQFGEQFPRAKA